MISYQLMSPTDLFSMDLTNLDSKTENYTLEYYLSYLLEFPHSFIVVKRGTAGEELSETSDLIYTTPIIGYIFGKLERKEKLCMHISALSVSPSWRNSGIASTLLTLFEMSGKYYGAFFSDLFVRQSNSVACKFYEARGYVLHQVVNNYYWFPDEDAYDMRKWFKTV